MDAQLIVSDPISIDTLLQNDPRLISKHTTRQYKADLQMFIQWLADRKPTKMLVEAYAAYLQSEGYKPRTINQRLSAIRWYCRRLSDVAADAGYDDFAKDAARIATVKDVKGDTAETGRHIEQGELSALLQACMSDAKNHSATHANSSGLRDAAMFAIAWSTGLRREEISNITVSDLFNHTTEGCDIKILGKGGKYRTVYVNDGTYALIMDWLAIRGSQDGHLFVDINKAGRIGSAKLSGEALRRMLDRRSAQAGLSQAITWHDFRRTFAGNLWDAKIDGVTIQKLMGHATQNQTARYDRRPEDARRQAVKVLHVPYRKRTA